MEYTENLKKLLEKVQDVHYAKAISQYMRNKFDFLGIKAPERKELLKIFFKENGLPTKENFEEIIKKLWEMPQREYQYCALEIFALFIKKNENNYLDLAEYLITQHSWWDTVDILAPNIVGKMFLYLGKTDEKIVENYTNKWANSNNIWLKRTSIIFQLTYKKNTNVELLEKYILLNQQDKVFSKEFFIQKAIGWALRQYARTDKEFVKDFVEKHHETLSNLSKREALKHLLKDYFE